MSEEIVRAEDQVYDWLWRNRKRHIIELQHKARALGINFVINEEEVQQYCRQVALQEVARTREDILANHTKIRLADWGSN